MFKNIDVYFSKTPLSCQGPSLCVSFPIVANQQGMCVCPKQKSSQPASSSSSPPLSACCLLSSCSPGLGNPGAGPPLPRETARWNGTLAPSQRLGHQCRPSQWHVRWPHHSECFIFLGLSFLICKIGIDNIAYF